MEASSQYTPIFDNCDIVIKEEPLEPELFFHETVIDEEEETQLAFEEVDIAPRILYEDCGTLSDRCEDPLAASSSESIHPQIEERHEITAEEFFKIQDVKIKLEPFTGEVTPQDCSCEAMEDDQKRLKLLAQKYFESGDSMELCNIDHNSHDVLPTFSLENINGSNSTFNGLAPEKTISSNNLCFEKSSAFKDDGNYSNMNFQANCDAEQKHTTNTIPQLPSNESSIFGSSKLPETFNHNFTGNGDWIIKPTPLLNSQFNLSISTTGKHPCESISNDIVKSILKIPAKRIKLDKISQDIRMLKNTGAPKSSQLIQNLISTIQTPSKRELKVKPSNEIINEPQTFLCIFKSNSTPPKLIPISSSTNVASLLNEPTKQPLQFSSNSDSARCNNFISEQVTKDASQPKVAFTCPSQLVSSILPAQNSKFVPLRPKLEDQPEKVSYSFDLSPSKLPSQNAGSPLTAEHSPTTKESGNDLCNQNFNKSDIFKHNCVKSYPNLMRKGIIKNPVSGCNVYQPINNYCVAHQESKTVKNSKQNLKTSTPVQVKTENQELRSVKKECPAKEIIKRGVIAPKLEPAKNEEKHVHKSRKQKIETNKLGSDDDLFISCTECKRMFTDEDHYEAHRLALSRIYVCHICDDPCVNLCEIHSHCYFHSTQQNINYIILRRSDFNISKTMLLQYIHLFDGTHNGTFVCACGFLGVSRCKLVRHIEKKYEKCKEFIVESRTRGRRQRAPRKPYRRKVTRRNFDIRPPPLVAAGPMLLQCKTCRLEFYNRYDYLEHVRFAHIETFSCDFCSFQVTTVFKKLICNHIMKHLRHSMRKSSKPVQTIAKL